MATTFSSKQSSFNKIFIIVFGIALGLVALALGFKGIDSTRDLRSRASLESTLIKGWEFNGTTTEGWKPGTITVNGENLVFYTFFNAAEADIVYASPFSIPTGIKNFQMNARISRPPTANVNQNQILPTIPVTIEVHFQRKSSVPEKNAYEDIVKSTLSMKATADGKFHTYTVPFTNTLAKYQVDRVAIAFKAQQPKTRTRVDINWMRITLQKSPTPTLMPKSDPTPTPPFTCRVTLSTYSVSEPCGTDYYRYVKYSCSDGYGASQGASASCKSAAVWKQYAYDDCTSRRSNSCITPAPPTRYPTPRPSSSGNSVPTWVQYTPTPSSFY